MIELRILSGARQGEVVHFSEQTVSIGRQVSRGLRISYLGVWDRHAEIQLGPDHRFHLRALSKGTLSVNSVKVQECPLKSGAQIELGALRLEFRLASSQQTSLRHYELLLLVLALALVCGQGFLVLFLAHT